jgi:hypothetical protein
MCTCTSGNDEGKERFARAASPHQHIPKLPGVALVDKQPGPVAERGPVGVKAFDGAEIRHLDFEAAAEIQLVGLDNPGGRIFQRPHHVICRYLLQLSSIRRVSFRGADPHRSKALRIRLLPCVGRKRRQHGSVLV